MAYIRLSAAEAAAMIKDQDTIALSGFTPNGVPKATFRELSKRAVAEHEAGRPFQVGILTGASTSQSIEGDMAAAHAIKFRAPFSTNKDFRTHTNLGEIDYEDMHLGHMAERLRRGFSVGGSTGGTDIIAAIVNKYRDISLGRVIMICDIFIISSSYLVVHDWEKVLYGYVVLCVSDYVGR